MIVSGVVQGVFFRAHTRERARSLNLPGWVRNLSDGTVEVVAEGPEDVLSRFVEWCHKGPAGARVDGVEIDWGSATGELREFDIRY